MELTFIAYILFTLLIALAAVLERNKFKTENYSIKKTKHLMVAKSGDKITIFYTFAEQEMK